MSATTTTVALGNRTFTLDRAKAEQAYADKRVINGKETMFFNILPLKYQWAYDLYKTMKNNHWEPEDITMQKDVEQWRSNDISDVERWIIKMGIGYFSAAEGIVGDNVLHVVREVVTAPELKLVLGRHAHEENIHADCAGLHDFLARHQPARVRGDVRGRPVDHREKQLRRLQQPRPAPRHRPHRSPPTSRRSPRTSSCSARSWKAPSSTASSA